MAKLVLGPMAMLVSVPMLVLMIVMVHGYSKPPLFQAALRKAVGLQSRTCQCESIRDIMSVVHTVAFNSVIRLLFIENIVQVGESIGLM